MKFYLSILLAVAFVTGCTTQEVRTTPEAARDGLAIVQGLTNETATQIAIIAPEQLRLQFEVEAESGAAGKASAIPQSKIASTVIENRIPESKYIVHHLRLTDLNPLTGYRLDIKNQYGRLVDSRKFETLKTGARPVRIAAASCMSDLYMADSHPMWKAVIDSKPDLLLLIGDNVYAAVVGGVYKGPLDRKTLWARYAETMQRLDYYRTPKLIPTLATWDDFDFGMKDGGLNNPHRLDAKTVFDAFFPQSATDAFPEYEKGPGVAAKFGAFGLDFYLLDNRTFRTAKGPGTPEVPQSHFGSEQEQWLFGSLGRSAKPAWLINGDQWFGGYHRFESYEGNHADSFRDFMKSVKQTKSTVFFLSGDRHLSEVMKIEPAMLGYETFEFTTSPLHAKTYPSNWDTILNKRHVTGVDKTPNFNLFEIEPVTKGKPLKLRVTAIGAESKVLYSKSIEIRGKLAK